MINNVDVSSHINIGGLIILLILFVLTIFASVIYYINLSPDVKKIKGFIIGEFSGIAAVLITNLIYIIEILFQTSGLATTLLFILFCASASGVAYGNQILLKNKDKVHLSEEEVDRRKALIPWQYGASIFTTVLCLVLLFI